MACSGFDRWETISFARMVAAVKGQVDVTWPCGEDVREIIHPAFAFDEIGKDAASG